MYDFIVSEMRSRKISGIIVTQVCLGNYHGKESFLPFCMQRQIMLPWVSPASISFTLLVVGANEVIQKQSHVRVCATFNQGILPAPVTRTASPLLEEEVRHESLVSV